MGDHVFLNVLPKRGVVRFGKRGKLSPRYIGPFEVLERVGIVAYQLALPPSLSNIHAVFHVSMLRKYTPDPNHVVDWSELVVDTDGTFEGPMSIMDSRDQVLRGETVKLVKVLWQNRKVEEVTWEREDMMCTNYPFLFEDVVMLFSHLYVYVCVNFGDEILLRGENVKFEKNLIFIKKGKTVICRYSTG